MAAGGEIAREPAAGPDRRLPSRPPPGLARSALRRTVSRMFRLPLGIWLTAAAAVAGSASAAGTNRFGFTGPEVFPLDPLVGFLRAADLDGDGLNDLVVVNNSRSKLTLLLNRTGRTNEPAAPVVVGRRDLNELPPDARFRIEGISSEKRISSLVVEDLNGDRRPDLAYYGEPRELVLQFNQGTNTWSAPKRYDLGDGLLDANALTTGDLNGDQRPDLLLLAEKHVYVLYQRADGTLAEPEKLPYAGTVKAAQVLDLDGDGRKDLLLVNWDNATPFRFRLQNAGAQLGPEVHLTVPPVRAYWADDLDGDGRTEVTSIAAKSGRAAVANFRRQPAEDLGGGLADGQFAVLPLPRTEKTRRGLAWADVNRDGRPDLLVADPEGGQLRVQVQQAGGDLAAPRTFPTYSGVADLAVADWNGDGAPELFVLSGDEKQMGVASFDAGGRVTFPQPLPLPGRPLAFAAGALTPGRPVLAVVTERDEKRTNQVDRKVETAAVRELAVLGADLKPAVQPLAETFKGLPATVALHDADQDGLTDVVVLTPYEKIRVLRQLAAPAEGRRFEEIEVTPPGGSTDQPWLAVADADGDGKGELLFAQKNFVRAVVLKRDAATPPAWNLDVRDQINGASSSSRIVSAAALPLPESRTPALFLLDADRKALTVCRRDTNGVWQAGRNLKLPFTEFTALQPLALGTDGAPDAIAFLGPNAAGWKRLAGDVWQVQDLDGYETPIKDGFLQDVTSGDLNGDGRKDLVFLEVSKAYVDLVTFEQPSRLVPADRWQVFEERTFRQRRNSERAEPREALVADFTGDGKADLLVLVHDRVLLYPQE
jgi:hypothetical protein